MERCSCIKREKGVKIVEYLFIKQNPIEYICSDVMNDVKECVFVFEDV
jgi:hypothetical protein